MFHACSGKLLRRGQVVKLELGFRIVSVGQQFALRTDLKAISIINEDVAQVMSAHVSTSIIDMLKSSRHSRSPRELSVMRIVERL